MSSVFAVRRDGSAVTGNRTGASLGIALKDARLGARIPRRYASLFSDLGLLKERSPAMYALLSEISIAPSAGAETGDASAAPSEVVFYLMSSPVPIRSWGKIDEALVRSALMVLDLLSAQGVLGDVEELDVRSSEAVYRMKEG